MKKVKEILIIAYLAITALSFLGAIIGIIYKCLAFCLISFFVFISCIALASDIAPQKGNGFNQFYD